MVITTKHNMEVVISKNNIKIKDSYKIKDKKQMKEILEEIFSRDKYKQTRKRKLKESILEWRTHNILFNFGLFVEHTRDCDISENEPILYLLAYKILGRF